ncbi:MAG: hypothetical protein ACTH4Y_08075 [Microbacterium gubbeenense]|uniref:hypothetical protein n=1 Tax=Microbacterium gubbeenense TaxID=159896 RepID=UPI003F95D041
MGINTAPTYARIPEMTFTHRRIPPYVRFLEGENDTPPAPKPGDKQEDLGFPPATPLEEMTLEQKAAYWRNESKKQQRRADKFEGLGDPADIRARITAADEATEQARLDALSDNEKAIEEARKEGREAGLTEGSGTWLKDAVQARVALLTQAPGESAEDVETRVNGVLTYIDAKQFVGDDGALDNDKLTNFAKSLGSGVTASSAPAGDPLLGHLQRQTTPAPGTGGSVTAIEQAAYDRITGKK